MKANPDLARIRLSDSELIHHVPNLVRAIANRTESKSGDITPAASEHGKLRRKQGYSAPMLVEDAHAVDDSIYEVIQNHLLSVDLSRLISDLRKVNWDLQALLKESF